MRLACALIFGLFVLPLVSRASDSPRLDEQVASAPFAKLRMDYAKQPDYSALWSVSDVRRDMLRLYQTDQKQFVERAGEWLKANPIDAQVHLMRAGLLLKEGDAKGHFYHRLMYYGLVTSILASGDGTSPKTAYQVISVSEEYVILNHIDAKVISQSLQPPCDVMRVEIDGKPATLYFDVSISLKAQARELEGKKGDGKKGGN